jgi:PLD-like domain
LANLRIYSKTSNPRRSSPKTDDLGVRARNHDKTRLFLSKRGSDVADPTTAFFSPNGGVEAATVAVIQAANATLDVGIYAINDNPITNGILAAYARGVTVRFLGDGHLSGSQNLWILKLFNAGVACRCAFQYASYHNKIVIADNTTVLTGSANFTYQANNANAENIVILPDATIAALFTETFSSDWAGALPYAPPRPHA